MQMICPLSKAVHGDSDLVDTQNDVDASNAKECDVLYCQPLSKTYCGWSMVFYSALWQELRSLTKMVPEMFAEAGVEERITNCSVRAAGVSQLFKDDLRLFEHINESHQPKNKQFQTFCLHLLE